MLNLQIQETSNLTATKKSILKQKIRPENPPAKSHASQIRRLVPGIQHGHHVSRAPKIRFKDFLQVVTSRRSSVHDQAKLIVHEEA